MAKKLYHIGFDGLRAFVQKNKSEIVSHLKTPQEQELSVVFGRAHYEIQIERFFKSYKIDKDPHYALQLLNHFKSATFIEELSTQLSLSRFDKALTNTTDAIQKQKILFFVFVYFLTSNPTREKEGVVKKIFEHYFLHTISIVNPSTQTQLNYKEMTLSYIKSKPITVKESYKQTEEGIHFCIYINKEEKVTLQGKSIKTLRKKAYKKAFFYLIDHTNAYTPQQEKQLSISELLHEI